MSGNFDNNYPPCYCESFCECCCEMPLDIKRREKNKVRKGFENREENRRDKMFHVFPPKLVYQLINFRRKNARSIQSLRNCCRWVAKTSWHLKPVHTTNAMVVFAPNLLLHQPTVTDGRKLASWKRKRNGSCVIWVLSAKNMRAKMCTAPIGAQKVKCGIRGSRDQKAAKSESGDLIQLKVSIVNHVVSCRIMSFMNRWRNIRRQLSLARQKCRKHDKLMRGLLILKLGARKRRQLNVRNDRIRSVIMCLLKLVYYLTCFLNLIILFFNWNVSYLLMKSAHLESTQFQRHKITCCQPKFTFRPQIAHVVPNFKVLQSKVLTLYV